MAKGLQMTEAVVTTHVPFGGIPESCRADLSIRGIRNRLAVVAWVFAGCSRNRAS